MNELRSGEIRIENRATAENQTMKSRAAVPLMLLIVSNVVVGGVPELVEPWVPKGISSELFESHAAFDPATKEIYFVRSSKTFSGWRILRARCQPDGWSTPAPAHFSSGGVEADPWFTPDGRYLYFISTRATGSHRSSDLDIWIAKRSTEGTWARPERLPEPVNSPTAEWFPRLASDGWLYFGSARAGGFGGNDIWRARRSASGAWRVENLGSSINTAGDEYEPLPSPDGSTLIVETGEGYYQSHRTPDGWSQRTRLGPEINANGTEIGAGYSPTGRTILFARDSGGPQSGEFHIWHLGAREMWPPACPEQHDD